IDCFREALFDKDEGLELGGVLRDEDGEVQIAALVGPRARYLDEEGVIDPSLVPVGELTQSLCSPWQWDFADCGCYYWAGSKPDLVRPAGSRGSKSGDQQLNLQRNRNKPAPERVPTTPEAWRQDEMTQPDMVQ